LEVSDSLLMSGSMKSSSEEMTRARDRILTEIRKLLSEGNEPVVVAIDGGSGAGKSTLAALVQEEVAAVIIPLDDFYAAYIPDVRWRELSPKGRFERVFKWDEVREVVQQLKGRRQAMWHAFDFDSPMPDGTYPMQPELEVRGPADVILLEGAYSSSPQLSDLIDLAVLVDVPVQERHARLSQRQDEEFSACWHGLWDEVEEYYFSQVRLKSSFDLVVEG
jgi:uridine kinase